MPKVTKLGTRSVILEEDEKAWVEAQRSDRDSRLIKRKSPPDDRYGTGLEQPLRPKQIAATSNQHKDLRQMTNGHSDVVGAESAFPWVLIALTGHMMLSASKKTGRMKAAPTPSGERLAAQMWENQRSLVPVPVLASFRCCRTIRSCGVSSTSTSTLSTTWRLRRSAARCSAPLVICRSKSGGAHCFVFFTEPVPAARVVSKLAAWAAALGYVKALRSSLSRTARYNDDDVGNWLNMPYFHAQRTSRFCVHRWARVGTSGVRGLCTRDGCNARTVVRTASGVGRW